MEENLLNCTLCCEMILSSVIAADWNSVTLQSHTDHLVKKTFAITKKM